MLMTTPVMMTKPSMRGIVPSASVPSAVVDTPPIAKRKTPARSKQPALGDGGPDQKRTRKNAPMSVDQTAVKKQIGRRAYIIQGGNL